MDLHVSPENPIIVALDNFSPAEAASLIDELAGLVWGFKANDLFLNPHGRDLIGATASRGVRWFVDLKLHDIPNTVGNQVQQLLDLKPQMLTVHLSGGPEMVEAAVASAGAAIGILGVSVLTSLSEGACQTIYGRRPAEVVRSFVEIGVGAGVHGVVCSGKELPWVKDFPVRKIVPGIRPLWYQQEHGTDDQARVMTPGDAVEQGADYLVIGRPITRAAPDKRRMVALATAREAGYHPFVAEALRAGALRFGDFKLKSGRKSPYFFNAGVFTDGESLSSLGRWYSRAIHASNRWRKRPNLIVGPAYKGIPIACATACAASMRYAYDRKEAKTHGDKGAWAGTAPGPGDVVIIVDDVITDGATKRQIIDKVSATGAEVVGVVVALDRMERGTEGSTSAVRDLEDATGVPVEAVATFRDIQAFTYRDPALAARLAAYRAEYGTT